MTTGDNAGNLENRKHESRVAVGTKTRRELKSLKRGGETYDCLLQKMILQYDPDEAPEVYL